MGHDKKKKPGPRTNIRNTTHETGHQWSYYNHRRNKSLTVDNYEEEDDDASLMQNLSTKSCSDVGVQSNEVATSTQVVAGSNDTNSLDLSPRKMQHDYGNFDAVFKQPQIYQPGIGYGTLAHMPVTSVQVPYDASRVATIPHTSSAIDVNNPTQNCWEYMQTPNYNPYAINFGFENYTYSQANAGYAYPNPAYIAYGTWPRQGPTQQQYYRPANGSTDTTAMATPKLIPQIQIRNQAQIGGSTPVSMQIPLPVQMAMPAPVPVPLPRGATSSAASTSSTASTSQVTWKENEYSSPRQGQNSRAKEITDARNKSKNKHDKAEHDRERVNIDSRAGPSTVSRNEAMQSDKDTPEQQDSRSRSRSISRSMKRKDRSHSRGRSRRRSSSRTRSTRADSRISYSRYKSKSPTSSSQRKKSPSRNRAPYRSERREKSKPRRSPSNDRKKEKRRDEDRNGRSNDSSESDRQKLIQKWRLNNCHNQDEMHKRLEAISHMKPDEIMAEENKVWIRSAPANCYYERDAIDPDKMRGTQRLQNLCETFKYELLDRGKRVRDSQTLPVPPPRKPIRRVCKHKSEETDSSDEESDISDDGDEMNDIMQELERKQKHPYRLHPELWYNDPGEMNDGPLCRCSAKARRSGIRHGFYAGENKGYSCDPMSNNAGKLYHYRITISPPTNFLTRCPTIINYDDHEFIFEGFSLISHYKIQKLPVCKVIRFNIEYIILYVEEKFPENFCIEEVNLFYNYLFKEVLELMDFELHSPGNTEGCPQFHFMPRFVRELPDNGRELLPMCEVLKYMLYSNKKLFDEESLQEIHKMSKNQWQNFADSVKGMVVTNPGMKPSSIRVDQLDRDTDEWREYRKKMRDDKNRRRRSTSRDGSGHDKPGSSRGGEKSSGGKNVPADRSSHDIQEPSPSCEKLSGGRQTPTDQSSHDKKESSPKGDKFKGEKFTPADRSAPGKQESSSDDDNNNDDDDNAGSFARVRPLPEPTKKSKKSSEKASTKVSTTTPTTGSDETEKREKKFTPLRDNSRDTIEQLYRGGTLEEQVAMKWKPFGNPDRDIPQSSKDNSMDTNKGRGDRKPPTDRSIETEIKNVEKPIERHCGLHDPTERSSRNSNVSGLGSQNFGGDRHASTDRSKSDKQESSRGGDKFTGNRHTPTDNTRRECPRGGRHTDHASHDRQDYSRGGSKSSGNKSRGDMSSGRKFTDTDRHERPESSRGGTDSTSYEKPEGSHGGRATPVSVYDRPGCSGEPRKKRCADSTSCGQENTSDANNDSNKRKPDNRQNSRSDDYNDPQPGCSGTQANGFYPEIVHFGIRPPQLSYAGNPDGRSRYQKAWRKYVKFRHLLANMPKPTAEDKQKLAAKESRLHTMRAQNRMKRDVTVTVSGKGFYLTGLMCDVIQHAMLIPVLVCHLRFHQSLHVLERTIQYEFKDKFLLQLALTHPSYRENFGTNSDHARNSLTNCGIRQPKYGDKRIHYMNTRKRGINTLINIMSRFGKKSETKSNIYHNERLEFLGDAVVEFITSTHLFHIFRDLEEGGLATYRAALVQNQHLAVLAKKLKLDSFMLYAHGSDLCHDLELKHAMANCFEALMGALFLDGGITVPDKVLANVLYDDDADCLDVWSHYPPHILQEQEPLGDRKWIPHFPFLQKLTEFEQATGIEFNHIRLLARAFTDRSVGFTNLTLGSNQRLEFLGDSVLQLISSEYLYKYFPEHHEGHLSLLRSSLVNNKTQSVVCDDLGMAHYAVYANPKVDLKVKDRADLLEAFLGALYVDSGLEICRVFCDVCFFPRLQLFIMNQDWNDPKSKLQQCCLTLRTMDNTEPDIPVYKVVECKGPTNTRVYTVAVYFRNKRLAKATGHSIQQAEMNAAQKAMEDSGSLFPQLDHQRRVIAKSLRNQRWPARSWSSHQQEELQRRFARERTNDLDESE